MKTIIVTGANGFIGRYAVNRLILEKYKVYTIDRNDRKFGAPEVTHIKAELSNSENVPDVIEKIGAADIMIHLAADIAVPGDSITIGNNISGLINTIAIAQKSRVRHFIYLSSIPLIGKISYIPIDEKHPVHPRSSYHWSKWLGEKMLEDCCDIFETISKIRIPSPIGAGMRDNVFLPSLLKKMIRGDDVEIYGSGKRIQNYIDVRDIAEALLGVIKNKSQGLYLIAGERSISNWDLAKLCKQTICSSSKIIKGAHIDPEESEQWIISYKKAMSEFDYSPQYDLKTSIRWIYENLK